MTNPTPPPSEDTSATNEQTSFAPLPTARTKALRAFLPWQILRFIAINMKMFRMIRMPHE